MSKQKLRLGISPCPNDTWIFGALALGLLPDCPYEFEVHYADVQTLNEAALQGDFDLIKISFGTWIHLEHHCLLNCGGAMGYGCGPLLLGKQDCLNMSEPVVLPGAGTTAALLFAHYARSQGLEISHRHAFFDEIYRDLCSGTIDQGVAIHECRFTWHQDGLHLIADLGAYWEQTQKAPIPLGAILLNQNHGALQKELETWIRRSIEYAESHPESLLPWIQGKAQIEELQVVHAHIKTYVNDFSKDIGDEGRRAMQVLKQLALSL